MATTWARGSTASARYTRVAIALHWGIAVAILYNLASGLFGQYFPDGFFALHISSGITILALSLLRVIWRITHKPPPMLPMARWEKGLAHGVHALLYAAMLIVPFSGWAMISARPPAGSPGAMQVAAERAARAAQEGKPAPAPRKAPLVWGVIPLPAIKPVSEVGRETSGLPAQRALHDRIETFHLIGGWLLLALFVLHVAGALKHQLVDRMPELARMGLGRARKSV